ncbi:hypothetical protein JIG36_06470 [Actinoplanes sp. LDG1-06]|uniref:Uncharacterized protein n=1 Tax=Paractinoplanes ovalisporus TaxID=2810368 RepID=A0ABS2A5T8_9ACTN|nr:hypothetical protein [Actinoplanes ovalisporus]MBM2615206.1 hypothetical protein [Actinoplanes ovalisporus]
MQPDYDTDPERFRTNQRATELFSHAGDSFDAVAALCPTPPPRPRSCAAVASPPTPPSTRLSGWRPR